MLIELESESSVPGNRLMSQLNCFLEMLVQLRSRETGCRRIIPLSMRGVMEVQRLRLMVVQSLLSQHLDNREKDLCHSSCLHVTPPALDFTPERKRKCVQEYLSGVQGKSVQHIYHLFHVLHTRMQTHSSWCVRWPKIFIQTSRWMTCVFPSFRGSLSGGGLIGGGRMTCRSIWTHLGGECGGTGRLVGVLLLKPRGVI